MFVVAPIPGGPRRKNRQPHRQRNNTNIALRCSLASCGAAPLKIRKQLLIFSRRQSLKRVNGALIRSEKATWMSPVMSDAKSLLRNVCLWPVPVRWMLHSTANVDHCEPRCPITRRSATSFAEPLSKVLTRVVLWKRLAARLTPDSGICTSAKSSDVARPRSAKLVTVLP